MFLGKNSTFSIKQNKTEAGKINSKHLKENYLLFILQYHVRGDDQLHASNIFDNEIVEEPMRQQWEWQRWHWEKLKREQRVLWGLYKVRWLEWRVLLLQQATLMVLVRMSFGQWQWGRWCLWLCRRGFIDGSFVSY